MPLPASSPPNPMYSFPWSSHEEEMQKLKEENEKLKYLAAEKQIGQVGVA